MNALRLCLGTLTVLPVRPPDRVVRRAAGLAMLLAPLAALLLAVVAGGVLWVIGQVAPPLLAAATTIGLLALLTRGIHLDGLADAADGLGSGRRREQALEVMRRGDVGPFGVVTLVLVLLVQVAALAALGPDLAPLALASALMVSRTVLPLLCLRGVPAARHEGLGAVVAGTVAPPAAIGCVVAGALLAAGLVAASGASTYGMGGLAISGLAVSVLSLACGAAYGWHCVRRFGGVTGDVLGAGVEVTFTAAVALLALLLAGPT